MTTINNSYNSNAYYQLFGQQSAAQPASSSSLVNALTQADNPTTNENDAYSVDLSPQAQAYLNSQKSTSTPTTSGSASLKANFNLTPAQQKQIDDILAKYKDAPYTQDTFKQIQSDLKAAHLDSDQLSLMDKLKSFNSTQVLIGYLNGVEAAPVNDLSGEKDKATNYTQSIMDQWKHISTTANQTTNAEAPTVSSTETAG